MPHHAMTPHVSGTSLSAQARYAAGTREILECYLAGKSIRREYQIVTGGKLAGAGAHSYTEGDATSGHATKKANDDPTDHQHWRCGTPVRAREGSPRHVQAPEGSSHEIYWHMASPRQGETSMILSAVRRRTEIAASDHQRVPCFPNMRSRTCCRAGLHFEELPHPLLLATVEEHWNQS
eukprot:CAMPEP_0185210260 /NCGR_PEP_ID=MMETSP1140-20130426/65283_1 /TAXON_ID=298111 /ORGANISM="Pavlova sp., Strain CCMP459" /LENGTH=178 /DNA_ID=CAMNT_0027778061 /DNA_START=46 /DNA_END=583 /DNA_ORIENTATION=+